MSSETSCTYTAELESITGPAHSVDVTAMSTSETWILLWKIICQKKRRQASFRFKGIVRATLSGRLTDVDNIQFHEKVRDWALKVTSSQLAI